MSVSTVPTDDAIHSRAGPLGRCGMFNGSVAIEGQPGGQVHVDEGVISLHAAGISNLFEVPVRDFLLRVGTKLSGAGAVPLGQSGSQGYGTLQNGLEVRHPLGFRVKDLVPDVGGSFVHYYFFPSAKFSLPGRRPLEVSHQFEFGSASAPPSRRRSWGSSRTCSSASATASGMV